MDVREAKLTLLRHAEGGPSETPDTLLTSLRPYRGIQEQHFLEILHALLVLAPELNDRGLVDRQVVYALWDLCRSARAWTRGPREPMFHGPRFIEPEEKKILDEWIDIIEAITLDLMRGEKAYSVFMRMPCYVLKYRWGPKVAFLTEAFVEALHELQKEETRMSVDDEVMICEVFESMGAEAIRVTPILRELQSKTNFKEVRSAAVKAMEKIAKSKIASDRGGGWHAFGDPSLNQ